VVVEGIVAEFVGIAKYVVLQYYSLFAFLLISHGPFYFTLLFPVLFLCTLLKTNKQTNKQKKQIN
jgi:hypothetical protein